MRSLLPLLVLTACGPSSIGDLSRPALVLVITEPGGFCGSTHAVDASDALWTESSCEGESTGLTRVRRADGVLASEEREELDALMDRVLELPSDPECEASMLPGRRYRFLRTQEGSDAWPETIQCEPTVPVDAADLAARLEALTTPPTDAGAPDA